MTRDPHATTPRRTSARRGFRTADAMILVAMIAIGFVLPGAIARGTGGFVSWERLPSTASWASRFVLEKPRSVWDMASVSSQVVILLILLCVPFLAMVSIALVPIRLLPPRPRRLALQPGAVAECAAVLAMVYVGLFYGTVRLAASKDQALTAADAAFSLMCLPIFVGFSIVSAWSTLLVTGLWRPEPSWIDRLGRFVGVAWIVAGLFNTCHYLIFHFNFSMGRTMISYW